MDYDKGHLLHGGISCEGVEAFEGAARESFVGGGGGVAPALSAASSLGIASENITHKVDANLLKHA